MSVAVPAYKNVCIAPDRSGSAVWLIGVSVAAEGHLEAYKINISNINSPTATLVASQSDIRFWSSQAQKACFHFPGNGRIVNSPIVIQQFGTKSVFTNVYPNGTIDSAKDFSNAGGVGFVSPKTFSLSGAVGDLNWFTALANDLHWTGLRLNGTAAMNSSYDFSISQYPIVNPLVSVGAFIPTSNTPAQGYHIVFDNIGGGVIYTTLANTAPIYNQDHILSLSNPQNVDMNGIKLTTSAVPVTMYSIAYIIDQAPDGSTVLYTINPGYFPKLQRVSVQGNVPPFSPSIAATALNSQIVVYRTSSSGVSTSSLNSFDTVRGTWSGPSLIEVYVPSSFPSEAPLGAIIGGVVGGLVVIALAIGFFVYRRRQNNRRQDTVPQQQQWLYHQPLEGPPALGIVASRATEGYAMSDTHKPMQPEPWIQPPVQPSSPQPQPFIYNQASYFQPHTPNRMPTLHEYRWQEQQEQQQLQQQQQPQPHIFQHHRPNSTATVRSLQMDLHVQPSINQFSDASSGMAFPSSRQKSKPVTPWSITRPQNQHFASIPDNYVDGEGPRNPQGFSHH
ncbi:hypothetical protein BGZ82_011101 [Podila clonocystis]|nr:hypothetical protein BGZ82_011101 [Podila clonocystis]